MRLIIIGLTPMARAAQARKVGLNKEARYRIERILATLFSLSYGLARGDYMVYYLAQCLIAFGTYRECSKDYWTKTLNPTGTDIQRLVSVTISNVTV